MSVRISPKDKARLAKARAKLLRWFARNGRSFFWRKVERNPYRVLVTEFMLQQTQTFRAEEYLPKFLKKYPTIKSLAEAKTGDVIKIWQGLGYNRRAINLQRSAQVVDNEFGGVFPSEEDQLLALPGVGEYTARALQVFAFGKRVSVVDVNVIRVLSRITKHMPTTRTMLPVKDIHAINTSLLPRSPEKWHEALMDFGATICKSRPLCDRCPIQTECASSSVLSKAKHAPLQKTSAEQLYYGSPKRIWRGRVLKAIAGSNKITFNKLVGLLSSGTAIAEFTSFISGVIDELAADGLCSRKGSHVTIKGS